MKKKIIAIAAVVMTLAIAVVGTLAYLTDTDQATNTFTTGNVKIELWEQERAYDEEGNLLPELVKFTEDKKLLPIVGSEDSGHFDDFGMPDPEYTKNYVDKMVHVKNTGSEDAYIRVYVAIPKSLDDGAPTYDASQNTLHFNFGRFQNEAGEWVKNNEKQWFWKTEGKWNIFTQTLEDDVAYNVYYADYYKVVAPGEETENVLSGVYFDKGVNWVDGKLIKNDVALPGADGATGNWTEDMQICMPVFAVAVQAEGFANAQEAFDAAGINAEYRPAFDLNDFTYMPN